MIDQGRPWAFAHPQRNLMKVLRRSIEITAQSGHSTSDAMMNSADIKITNEP
jgi:hypothetical protein